MSNLGRPTYEEPVPTQVVAKIPVSDVDKAIAACKDTKQFIEIWTRRYDGSVQHTSGTENEAGVSYTHTEVEIRSGGQHTRKIEIFRTYTLETIKNDQFKWIIERKEGKRTKQQYLTVTIGREKDETGKPLVVIENNEATDRSRLLCIYMCMTFPLICLGYGLKKCLESQIKKETEGQLNAMQNYLVSYN